jgi:hypothetical protein
VEVLVPFPVVGVQGPLRTAEVAESSLARVSLTVEKMMDLETYWYIDFPGVRVIDLEACQLQEKEYEAMAKRTSNEPTIMETIASVSKALQEYKCAGGFASAAATDAEDATLAVPAAHVEPTEDAFVPSQMNDVHEAPPPLSVETTGASIPVAEPSVTKVVVREGTSSPRRVAAEAEGVETLMFDELATIAQESAIPEMMTRVTISEI